MNIKFSTQPRWNSAENHHLSFETGKYSEDPDAMFTEKQVRDLLITLRDISQEAWKGKENFLSEAAKNSVLIEVIRGVHHEDDPHLMVDFLGQLYHIQLAMSAPGQWKAVGVPELKRLEVDSNTSQEFGIQVLSDYQEYRDVYFSNHLDVNGFAIGYAETRKRTGKELALVAFVTDKLTVKDCSQEQFIGKYDTYYHALSNACYLIRIDVVQAPPFEEDACPACPPAGLRVRFPKIKSGISISNASVGTSGSLGGFLIYKRIATVALSNRHIMKDPAVVKDNKIIQPGRKYGGKPLTDTFALRFKALKNLDAAIAKADSATSKRPILFEMACTGSKVRKIKTPILQQTVRKIGPTSGCTTGTVTNIRYKDNTFKQYGFNNILVRGNGGLFTQPGDSGSLYEDNGIPGTFVGLHWGKNGVSSVGHPLPVVAQQLSLSPTVSAAPEMLVEEGLRQAALDAPASIAHRELKFPIFDTPQPFFLHFHDALKDHFQEAFSENGTLGIEFGYALADTLLTADGWRAAVVTLMEIFKSKIAAQEVLHHALSQKDISNLIRFIKIAGWESDESEQCTQIIAQLQQMLGQKVSDLISLTTSSVHTLSPILAQE